MIGGVACPDLFDAGLRSMLGEEIARFHSSLVKSECSVDGEELERLGDFDTVGLLNAHQSIILLMECDLALSFGSGFGEGVSVELGEGFRLERRRVVSVSFSDAKVVSGARFDFCFFDGVYLSSLGFRDFVFMNCVFYDCSFEQSWFDHCDFVNCVFFVSDPAVSSFAFSDCDLFFCEFESCVFRGKIFEDVRFWDCVFSDAAYGLCFWARGCYFMNVSFFDIAFWDVDGLGRKGLYWDRCKFVECFFGRCDFSSLLFGGSDFSFSNLFRRCGFEGCVFDVSGEGEVLKSAVFDNNEFVSCSRGLVKPSLHGWPLGKKNVFICR